LEAEALLGLIYSFFVWHNNIKVVSSIVLAYSSRLQAARGSYSNSLSIRKLPDKASVSCHDDFDDILGEFALLEE
jgi:hypothetical protein